MFSGFHDVKEISQRVVSAQLRMKAASKDLSGLCSLSIWNPFMDSFHPCMRSSVGSVRSIRLIAAVSINWG